MTEEYITLDNGGDAFVVAITGNSAAIKRCFDVQFIRSFIGTDLTRPDRLGNSILLQLNDCEYMYIGGKVKKFTLESPVVSYHSPIGPNDVVYPFAVCENGDIVLLIENVIVKRIDTNIPIDTFDFDARIGEYARYYAKHFIIEHTWSANGNWSPVASGYKSIARFYIGTSSYNLQYQPFPATEWNRYQTFEEDGVSENGISIEYADGTRRQLTQDEYCELIEEFGVEKGFAPLQSETLIGRLFGQ